MRHPMLICATGMQGVGKSYTTLKQCIYQAYLSKHPRSTLIADINDEYGSYKIDGKIHKIQILPIDDVIKFSNSSVKEVRRIVFRQKNGLPLSPEEIEKIVIRILNYYRGGTLLLEDLNRVYADNLPQSIVSLLMNVRHRNCDVMFHLQSCGRIVPKMRQNVKIIRYHYQLDSIADSEDKLKGESEVYKIAEKIVNKQYEDGNIRFFVYIYREIKKIKGQFSPKMFTEAIQEYISENEKCIRPLLMKRDAKGKKIYNYEQSIRIKTEELFKKYWGN